MKTEFILAYPKHILMEHLCANVRGPNRCRTTSETGMFAAGPALFYTYDKAHHNGFEAFAEIFDGLSGIAEFGRREEIEKDFTKLHPIPYIVFQRPDDSTYLYQRGKLGGEGRLSGNESVGIGGHVEIGDGVNAIPFVSYLYKFAAGLPDWLKYGVDLRAMVTAVLREFNEEVRLKLTPVNQMVDLDAGYEFEFLGALHDQSDGVGQNHLGLVFRMMIPQDAEVVTREKGVEDRGFFLPEQIIDDSKKGLISLENWSKIVVSHLYDQRCLKANNA
jgi:predicted NUDIX family phosphoesterase